MRHGWENFVVGLALFVLLVSLARAEYERRNTGYDRDNDSLSSYYALGWHESDTGLYDASTTVIKSA